MNSAVISVGSNISPGHNIKAAEEILREEQALLKASRFELTVPVPPAYGADYLNGAFLLETPLEMEGLEAYLKDVEDRLGRTRSAGTHAPRTIDLDIIVFNGRIVDEDYFIYDFVKRAVDELVPQLRGRAGRGAAQNTPS